MSRTLEGYDDQRERIEKIFPGRMSLKVSEVASAEGIDKRTARKRFPFSDDGMISVEAYIRSLCLRNRPAPYYQYGIKKGAIRR